MVTVVPTLVRMAEIYRLPREGGNASPRFHAYVRHVEHEWGFVAYNPMAGDAAAETVDALIALEAEPLARDAAQAVATDADYQLPITLAVIVRSKGMWTDRVATAVQDRTAAAPPREGHGLVQLWSREPVSAALVRVESAAECARIIWHSQHGPARTARAVLAREGHAYAAANRITKEPLPYGPATDEDRLAVGNAIEILGNSREQSDVAAILFGDASAAAMGWTPLGVPEDAGYRVAIERAMSGIP
jgi:hypothetical protein